MGAETNLNCNVQLKGVDFDGSFPVTNVKFDDDATLDQGESGTVGGTDLTEKTFTTSYATWFTTTAGSAVSEDAYHWVSVPNGLAAGSYSTTLYYQAIGQ